MSGLLPGAGIFPRRFIAGAVSVGALVALAGFGTPAQAAFTTGKCLGESNFQIGRGASFARLAHNDVWIPTLSQFCADVGTTPAVTYDSRGSGSGRRVMGERTNGSPEGDNTAGALSRNQVPRFGMSEEPPSETGQAQVNQGTNAVGDEGQMRLIPAALGAVAIAVNLPDGCNVYTNPDGSVLTGAAAERFSNLGVANQQRLRLTRQQLERIWAGDVAFDEWGEIVPHINDGNATPAEASDTRCQDFPIVRVRRLDDGGTTFVFKDYLNSLNPATGWKSTFVTPDTRTWPAAATTVAFDYNGDNDTADAVPNCAKVDNGASNNTGGNLGCTEAAVPTLQTTVVPAGNGNNNLIDKVHDFDGSIGYGDIATVRERKSFAFERQTGADDKFWVQIQTKNLTGWADPQSAPTGFTTGGSKGSNCGQATLINLPGGNDPTLANWAAVSAVDSSQAGYGICSLTYFIAFDDYAGVYPGDQAAEERKARTVRDYIEHTVGFSGQVGLQAFDYGTLPLPVQQLALAAAQKIGWNKGTGAANNPAPQPDPVATPAPAQSGGAASSPSAAGQQAPPSSAFTIASRRLSKGKVVLSLQLPGAGSVRATATARSRGRTIQVASSASTIRAAGRLSLTLKPSKATIAALKRGSLRVTIRVTYQPSGGQASTQTTALTMKKTKASKRR